MSKNLNNQELSQEEIKKLLEEASKEGKEEAKFLLRLSEWNRPGPSFIDVGRIKVLYGEIEKVMIDRIYEYPTTNSWKYLIIPKSRVVVLLFEWEDNYKGKLVEHQELYVFNSQRGWIKLDLY